MNTVAFLFVVAVFIVVCLALCLVGYVVQDSWLQTIGIIVGLGGLFFVNAFGPYLQ